MTVEQTVAKLVDLMGVTMAEMRVVRMGGYLVDKKVVMTASMTAE